MGSCGSCVFKAGYKMYADTPVGRYLHKSMIQRFQNKYGKDAFHSRMTQFVICTIASFGNLIIIPIPVLTTNYTYVVADAVNLNFVLIDVGHEIKFLTPEMKPDAILTTHKHWDHCHGNREMHRLYPDVPIYGGDRENVPDATVTISDGEVIKFGRLQFTAVWTPGHTRGHICYLLDGVQFDVPSSLFTGDHLMLGGCGANFECSIKVMVASLDKMLSFPADTMIWPGHEVGLPNLLMAVFLEEDNSVAQQKLLWVVTRRIHKLCTCPSSVGEERLYNPFLRTHDPTMLSHLELISDMEFTNGNSCSPCPKGDNGSVEVACFKEILKRLKDPSEEARKRKSDIIKRAFGGHFLCDLTVED